MKRLARLHQDERGMSFVFVGMGFMAFLAASTLAIDVGMFMTARSQAQNSADAGALAGAVALAFNDYNNRSASGPAVQNALVAARAKRADGESVLHGHRTTCLPKYMERAAYFSTFWRRGRYYRTYPAYVEDEVRAALASPADFERGPRELSKRGTRDDDTHAFVVEDGHYISARWPGDAHLFARRLLEKLGQV